jgi:hypothetical protein
MYIYLRGNLRRNERLAEVRARQTAKESPNRRGGHLCNSRRKRLQSGIEMAKKKEQIFEVACPDCGAMLRIDAATGLLVSHTSAPRKRMFEDLETAAQAMRAQDERKESIFRQSVEAEKNKEDLFEKKFADALRKAKDAPEGKPLREFDLD